VTLRALSSACGWFPIGSVPGTMLTIFKAKRALCSELVGNANVLGVGVGYATKRALITGEIAIVVFVKKKLRVERVPQGQRIPTTFQSFRVDVVEHAVTRPCNCTSTS